MTTLAPKIPVEERAGLEALARSGGTLLAGGPSTSDLIIEESNRRKSGVEDKRPLVCPLPLYHDSNSKV